MAEQLRAQGEDFKPHLGATAYTSLRQVLAVGGLSTWDKESYALIANKFEARNQFTVGAVTKPHWSGYEEHYVPMAHSFFS